MENENQKIIPPINTENEHKNGVVKTYADDLSKEIEKAQSGTIRQIIKEQEEREAITENISPVSERNKFFMLVGGGLIILAIGLLALISFLKNNNSTTNTNNQLNPIIFMDKTDYADISGLNKDEIAQTLLNKTNSTDVKSGGLEGIYLIQNQKIVGLKNFLSLVGSDFNLNKTTVIDDNFFIGVTNKDSKDLFFLLKVKSFFDALPVLKNWESDMFYDLHGFFGVDINADTKDLLTKDFEDGVSQNKNARILRDKNGNIVLEYVFIDDNSVVIANNEQAVQEAVLRLIQKDVTK